MSPRYGHLPLLAVAAAAVALVIWRPWSVATDLGQAPQAPSAVGTSAPDVGRVAGLDRQIEGSPHGGGGLSGVVVDRRGRPVAGVDLTAVPATDVPAVSTRSDPEGRFWMRGMSALPLRLLLRHPDYLFENVAVDSEGPLRIDLSRRPVVVGSVVEAQTGAAVPEFCAVLAPLEDGVLTPFASPPPGAEWSRDDAGTFRLVAEQAGPHGLYVFSRRAPTAQLRLDLTPDSVVEQDVSLRPGIMARGMLRDASGSPVVGASIHLQASPGLGAVVVTTDADGSFELPPLAAGAYGVTAQAPALPVYHRDDVRLDESGLYMDIQLPEGASLSGVVQPWRPGQQAEVVARHVRGPVRRAPVDVATGRYSLSNLTPGEHYVAVERDEPTWRSRVAHHLFAAAAEVDVDLQPGQRAVFDPVDPVPSMAQLRGRVTGSPRPEELTVRAFCEGRSLPPRITGLFRATPTADGGFVIDGLVPGRWRFQMQSGTEVLHWEVLDFAPGADLEHVFVIRGG